MAVSYLTREHLIGFEHYKYSALDTNPLSNYVMHPFWNFVVKFCPNWLAPNVLTFTGFLLTVVNFLLFTWYDYYFYGESVDYPQYPSIPSWVWLVVAVNHFLAHTLDGIDGKQARRTSSSSPLGELFDHGLDSWTAIFIPTCLYSVFGRDDHSISPLRFYLCLWSIFFTFLSSHWEKYNTGVLYLPWGYDFSQIVALIVYIITYIHSTAYWKFTIPYFNISPGILFEIILNVCAYCLSLPVSLINIYLSYRNKTGKLRTLYEANRPLVSIMLFFIICSMWVFYSPSDIIMRDPRCFYFLMGTVFSNMCCRLIVSQMTNTRCELLNWMLAPLGFSVLFVLQFRIIEYERHILYALTIFLSAAHIHYGVRVVQQMCEHFNMHCFFLKKLDKF